jgi:D-tagatose-1,6-bisphosphate aldolase subunit GatZ/KbaZ
MSEWLLETIARHKRGEPLGVVSICSAHPEVLTVAVRMAAQGHSPLLVESTCNQVNQDGGYTGLTPAAFASQLQRLVSDAAGAVGLTPPLLTLGGDHLGPFPWRDLPASRAMEKARRLVADYVKAGYTKLHLDASMRLADDPPDPLPEPLIAARCAELCATAEAAYRELPSGSPPLCYVIGTEVPRPGGAISETGALQVTEPQAAAQTLELSRLAFIAHGLADAWERAIALVVQPGVEFGDALIHDYERQQAAALSRWIEGVPNLVFEAHSTDYQTPQALRELVQDHFAILKVGPALTFALREGLFALEDIESAIFPKSAKLSHLRRALEDAMLADPTHWKEHYHGSPAEQRFARQYSFSDRIRYYWTAPAVQQAVQRLYANLADQPLPLALLSQVFPFQFEKIRAGRLPNQPRSLLHDNIARVLDGYLAACAPK